ncbi:MAG: sigma-54-dependent Fis family transcriptional regulator [Thermodesulfovibrionia bacterium]|nr:sigma-54-dependent Fis family transcriptional regulator [Thermodesulfovibrionia bacterium]
MARARILIVDDEEMITSSLKKGLEKEGYDVITASSGEKGIESFKDGSPDITLLDINLPIMDGLKVLDMIKKINKDAVVIMITAFGGVDSAVRAMKLGAYDYIEKPFDLDRLNIIIKKALETATLKQEVRQLKGEQQEKYSFENIVGESSSLQKMIELARKIAESDATTVLIQGKSGTGKDLLARTIHFNSKRAEKTFIEVTCTALPETLIESELFGFEKGAFTDAKTAKKGLVELAEGGTVYLDEIGDMKPSTQAKLLRVIEEKTFKRIGGLRDIKVDVRIIAASNKDLQDAVKNGEFREDLYYRLKVIPVYMPALSERKEDIIPLVKHFISVFSRELKKNTKELSTQVKEIFMNYMWPGNVRELKNIIERVFILEESDTILPEHLPKEIVASAASNNEIAHSSFAIPHDGISLEHVEKDFIHQALQISGGNQTKAAKLLGLSRDALRYRMQKFGLL